MGQFEYLESAKQSLPARLDFNRLTQRRHSHVIFFVIHHEQGPTVSLAAAPWRAW